VRSHRFSAKLPFWTKPTHICPAAIAREGNVNWAHTRSGLRAILSTLEDLILGL